MTRQSMSSAKGARNNHGKRAYLVALVVGVIFHAVGGKLGIATLTFPLAIIIGLICLIIWMPAKALKKAPTLRHYCLMGICFSLLGMALEVSLAVLFHGFERLPNGMFKIPSLL